MQTKRPPARRSIWESGVWNPLGSLSVGVGILGACLCLMVGLFCIANAADWMISCMAAAALIASGYGMGFFCRISSPAQRTENRIALRRTAVLGTASGWRDLARRCQRCAAPAAAFDEQRLGRRLRRQSQAPEAAALMLLREIWANM